MTSAARAVAGAISVVLLAAVGYGGSLVALGAWRPDYRVQVVLGELGQGIVSGSDVKMRGVIVGEVGEIGLTDDLEAIAELVLEERYPIPERATFRATAKTLLGEKQIEVVFDGPYDVGPFLAEGTVVRDESRVVELEDVLGSLARLTEAIDPDDLAVVVDELFGAFDGMGPAIARSVDSGAQAAGVFRGTLDDQVAGIRDLSLVAESLGEVGDDFNRLGRTVVEGLPTLSENQREVARLLDELGLFARRLDATFTVNRRDIDRMIIEGDNVLRLLFAYRPQVGEVLVSGLASYGEKFPPGFRHPTVQGQAAYFQIILDSDDMEAQICGVLPTELIAAIPVCEPYVDTGPGGEGDDRSLPVPGASAAPLAVSLPRVLTRPEVPGRLDVDALVRRTLPDGTSGDRRRGTP